MSGAVKRFRVMALVAGVMSLLLWFVDLPVAYLFNNDDWKSKVEWIPFVHGWIYAVYVLTAIQFGTKTRWPLTKILWLILAGTLPIASFAAERRVVRQYP
jgi:integral membrane protein